MSSITVTCPGPAAPSAPGTIGTPARVAIMELVSVQQADSLHPALAAKGGDPPCRHDEAALPLEDGPVSVPMNPQSNAESG